MDKKPVWNAFSSPWMVFIYFFMVRLAFISFSGYDNYDLQEDSSWYVGYADAWLRHDFNFDIGRFILSPGYVCFIAANKVLFGDYWEMGIVGLQLLVCSLSGVYFYKLARLLFDESVAFIATALYGILPLTLWWVHTFASEILFQSFLIISLYYFMLSVKSEKIFHLVISAILFGIILLTKSHIILFTPFIVLYYFFNGTNQRVKFLFPVLYGLICVLCLLPFSVYCFKTHNTFVLSSNGSGYQFYLGNTEVGYTTVVNPPEKETPEFDKLQDIVVNAGYFNGSQQRYDSIMQLPQSVKQGVFMREAKNWIKANPAKWVRIKLQDIISFLKPGVSYEYYPFTLWLIVFLVYGPIYLLAYLGIIFAIKKEGWRKHLPVIGLFVTVLLFSVVWYVQNRFRTITIEPFYIIYFSYVLVLMLKRWPLTKNYFTSS